MPAPGAPLRHAIRLLDEDHPQTRLHARSRRHGEVRCADAAARAMTEEERRPCIRDVVYDRTGRAVPRLDERRDAFSESRSRSRPSGCLVNCDDVRHVRSARAVLAVTDERLDAFLIAFEDRLEGAVVAVPNPAAEAARLRGARDGHSEADALNAPRGR